jgi:N-acetylmuramoyl-L-alanine amidase
MVRTLTLFAAAAMSAIGATAGAQPAAPPTAQSLYEEAFALEHVLRDDLDAEGESESLVSRLRGVITVYEQVVRRYPTSGYCDNALWQAAGLAREAVRRWDQERDRRTELRMLKWLVSEYPASPYIPRARAEVAKREAAGAPSPPPPNPSPPGRASEDQAAPQAEGPAGQAATVAEVRAVRRTVLPTGVRVTIELDREVPYATERLDKPARVFFDFAPSRPSTSVADVSLTFGDDIVRGIRIGARPGRTTRVAIDLDGARSYSAYAMYNPYRLVVDFERGQPVPADPTLARTAPAPPGPPVERAQPPAPASPRAGTAAAAAPERRATDAPPVPDPARRPPLAAASWGPAFLGLSRSIPPDPLPRGPESARGTASTAAARPPPGNAPAPAAPVAHPDETPAPPASNIGGGYSLARQLGLGVSRIVIDPGHGGHDPGAQNGGSVEANIVLDVALRLEKLLLTDDRTEVVLTRRTDAYVGLEERTAVANRAQADLFLSIHANANRSRDVSGIESYFLNFARTADAAAVAARENAAAGMNMGSLPDVVKAIALSSKVNESRDFATLVQQALVRRLRGVNRDLKDLGVKQAPFVVLIGAAMPSVLVEISFITNGQESRLLRDAVYRQRIAEALADGVRRYQQALKTGRPVLPQ